MFRLADRRARGREYGVDNWRKLSIEDNMTGHHHLYAYLAGDRQDDHLAHACAGAVARRRMRVTHELHHEQIERLSEWQKRLRMQVGIPRLMGREPRRRASRIPGSCIGTRMQSGSHVWREHLDSGSECFRYDCTRDIHMILEPLVDVVTWRWMEQARASCLSERRITRTRWPPACHSVQQRYRRGLPVG